MLTVQEEEKRGKRRLLKVLLFLIFFLLLYNFPLKRMVANRYSRKYHRLNCPYGKKIRTDNKVYIKTAASLKKLEKAGYKACRYCNPDPEVLFNSAILTPGAIVLIDCRIKTISRVVEKPVKWLLQPGSIFGPRTKMRGYSQADF